ncbi:MAG: SDR family NAD(P)-dependent oxidoreductase [Bacteroidetes bacterium]|nr:SDR family NAD(P)-dependent oxidoreductase [Bacteroidota bacterium]
MALTVIITGASRGIGKALAIQFATAGYKLLLSARHAEGLAVTAKELRKQFPNSEIHEKAVDLSIAEQAMELGQWCLSLSTPDILINNAGVYQPGSLADEPAGQLEKHLQVNLGSAYHLTRALLPTMIQRGAGHIFNICSIASLQAYPNGGSYCISKHALHGFTQNLREELKPTGVKVTGVYPGAVLTDSWGDFDNSSGRILEADDVAKMVLQAAQLSPQACVEQIVLRPRLGDL